MKKKNKNLCEIKGCYEPMYLKYYNHNVCRKHWVKYASLNTLNLKKVFNIPEQEKVAQNQNKPTLEPFITQ